MVRLCQAPALEASAFAAMHPLHWALHSHSSTEGRPSDWWRVSWSFDCTAAHAKLMPVNAEWCACSWHRYGLNDEQDSMARCHIECYNSGAPGPGARQPSLPFDGRVSGLMRQCNSRSVHRKHAQGDFLQHGINGKAQ